MEKDPEYEAAYQAELQRLAKEELDKARQKQEDAQRRKAIEAEREKKSEIKALQYQARIDAAREMERLRREEEQKRQQEKRPKPDAYVALSIIFLLASIFWVMISPQMPEGRGLVDSFAAVVFFWGPVLVCFFGIAFMARQYRKADIEWFQRHGVRVSEPSRESVRDQALELAKWIPVVALIFIGLIILILYLTDNMGLLF